MFRIFPLYSVVICAHWLWGEFTPQVAVKHVFLLAAAGELWAIPAEVSYYFVIPFIAVFTVRFGRARGIQALSAALLLAFLFNLAFPQYVFRPSGFIHSKLVPFFAGSLGALLALERGVPAGTAFRRVVAPALAAAGFVLATLSFREAVLAENGFREPLLGSRDALACTRFSRSRSPFSRRCSCRSRSSPTGCLG